METNPIITKIFSAEIQRHSNNHSLFLSDVVPKSNCQYLNRVYHLQQHRLLNNVLEQHSCQKVEAAISYKSILNGKKRGLDSL